MEDNLQNLSDKINFVRFLVKTLAESVSGTWRIIYLTNQRPRNKCMKIFAYAFFVEVKKLECTPPCQERIQIHFYSAFSGESHLQTQ